MNSTQFKIVFSVFILLYFIPSVQCTQYNYFRDLTCLNITNNRCVNWTQSLFVSKSSYRYFCFPQDTYVETKNGTKSMAQLVVGDQVLGLNPSNGQIGYSVLQSWLHRDTVAQAEFQALRLQNGTFYQASGYHNLAYFDQKGKLNYKFANQFKQGDRLVAFPYQSVKIVRRDSGIKNKGLYSPYTQFKNYFVYEKGFSRQNKKGSMILAHALSQVQNPSNKNSLTDLLMWGTNLFGNSYQPSKTEIYTHPVVSHFSFLYGSSWKQAHNPVTYSHQDWLTALDISTSHGASTNSAAQRRQRERKITYAITSIIAMLNDPVNN